MTKAAYFIQEHCIVTHKSKGALVMSKKILSKCKSGKTVNQTNLLNEKVLQYKKHVRIKNMIKNEL